MTSERVQRQVERLLDEADQAAAARRWDVVKDRTEHVLTFDPDNADARALLAAAERGLEAAFVPSEVHAPASAGAVSEPALQQPGPARPDALEGPTSFANGRYIAKRFLGEGGKKKVYLAHDTLLDRDVAFALIKTEGLDEVGRQRITREAQSMGRLGDHPNIVTVYDIGEEQGTGNKEPGSYPGLVPASVFPVPYMVLPLLPGGDVEGLIEKAPEHRLMIERLIQVGVEVCQGLEFAHAKGIVHRDLKPGNVWLAQDGRAQIGDFGLAVAVDKSRLTQAGMMVGTVNYMPPEQAMGGEVGPRSDLYSLGCMLYEMVCGRPPFVGDEAVAIIGQHLNTPPVAPSWHRPDCPPGLEALIMRLLEKDPAKRPASAEEVRTALQSISSRGSTSSPGTDNSPVRPELVEGRETSTGDPLYRRTFVGREQELRQLHAAFDAALSGRGSLAMVVGEPGIGKTSVCEQLATYVALRGGKSLIGHCYEEGSLSLPYLPFVEAMRSYVLAREPDDLRKELGSGASEVARIVSEVRDKVQVSPSDAGDPEEQRWRLLQAVTSFLRNASMVQPLLLVLEDLHDADRGTLDLLLHLSRNLEGARLLIAGTYRDVEVDRAHPLSAAVAELRRAGSFLRVPLRGLTVDEVHRMYEAIRGQSVAWAQAELVHRQTEGNPLFVQEVLRYLVEEGIVVRESGRYNIRSEDQANPAAIPEGLRDVVGKRLSRLGERANQLLSVASVIGREFRLDVIQKVAGLAEEELYAALEESQERAIIEQRQMLGSLGFRFTHAFFRQTLYEEIFAPRRIRIHQQVGRALEEVHARRLEEHAAELAEHFAQSTETPDLEEALHYCELAAQRATSVFAHSEAAGHLEQALRALEVLDPDAKAKRCDLLIALSESLGPAGDPRRIVDEIGEEALGLAVGLGDSTRAARICRLVLMAIHRLDRGRSAQIAEPSAIWAERAVHYAEPETGERVVADVVQAIAAGTVVHQAGIKGMDLARRLDDNEAFFFAARLVTSMSTSLKYALVRDSLANEIASRDRRGVSARLLAGVLTNCGFNFIHSGNRTRGEALWRDVEALAERSQDAAALLYPVIQRGSLAWLDGRLDDAVAIAADLEVRAHEQGSPGMATFAERFGVRALIALGQPGEYISHGFGGRVGFGRNRGADTGTPYGLLAFAHLDRKEEAILELSQLLTALPDDPDSEEIGFYDSVLALEAAVLLRERDAAARLIPLLAPFSTLAGMHSHNTAIGRHVGAAAKLLGRPDEARNHYNQALAVCEKVRFRPEIALTRLALAELLLEHYPDERVTAIEHLDFAIGELREMKMQPSLERALRHRGLLKA